MKCEEHEMRNDDTPYDIPAWWREIRPPPSIIPEDPARAGPASDHAGRGSDARSTQAAKDIASVSWAALIASRAAALLSVVISQRAFRPS